MILLTTLALLAGGFLFFYAYEFRLPQWESMTGWQRLNAAAFQSITPRTAGFNTVDLTQLSESGKLLTTLLMLTGGSPGSTAGGFKTTTLAVLLLSAFAVFHRRGNAQCFAAGFRNPQYAAAAPFFFYTCCYFWPGAPSSPVSTGVPLLDALFEAASAIGTVGLSTIGTANLSTPSHLILISLMYIGRVGGLTLIYAVTTGGTTSAQYPQEPVTVG